MSIKQKFEDAFADFKGLIAEGWEIHTAIIEAATSSGLAPDVLEKRLSRTAAIETRVEQIRRESDYKRFVAIADKEIEKCKIRTGAYARIGLLGRGSLDKVAETIEHTIQRTLTEHEIWIIEERLNPLISEIKLAHKAKVKPLRKLSFGD